MKYTYGHRLGGGVTTGIWSNVYRHGSLDRIGAPYIHSSRPTEAIEAGNNMTDDSVDQRGSRLDNHQDKLLPGFTHSSRPDLDFKTPQEPLLPTAYLAAPLSHGRLL
jgi:hypothetical protein